MTKKLVWNHEKCIFCGGCVAVCPPGNVITVHEDSLDIEHGNCIRCGKCVKVCPMGALSMEAGDGGE